MTEDNTPAAPADGAARPTRVLIVDDESPARRRMRDLLGDCAQAYPVEVVGEAESGRQALELTQSLNADLLFLDIRMADMDGLELARHLLKLARPPAVIFTTAYEQHAIDAFEVNAIDYLLKPVRTARLLLALQKVRPLPPSADSALERASRNARRHLSISERSRVILVPIEDVIYLKAELKYLTIRTAEREFLLEESLTRLEEEFGERFVRIHRNSLVARVRIEGFERKTLQDGDTHWEVVLRGVTERLPVSRRQQHLIRELGRGRGALSGT
ncbi:MAG: LytTR family DNA-binding domain-containing protein [Betaproteobacteria bacterium]